MVKVNAPLTELLIASIAIEKLKRDTDREIEKVKATRARLQKIIKETI